MRGATEIKNHPWLKNFSWKDLYYKKMKAPYVPQGINNYDKKYCESIDKIGNETRVRYQKIALSLQNFDDFTYVRLEAINSSMNNKIDSNSNPKEFYNPHPFLFEIKDDEEEFRKQINYNNNNNSPNNEMTEKPSQNKALKLESNFVKKKHQAFSLSNLTLMKEYKMANHISNDSAYSIQLQLND